MMANTVRLCLLAAVGFYPLARPVSAAVLSYTDRSSFLSALPGTPNAVDFGSVLPAGSRALGVPAPPGLSLGGLNFDIDRGDNNGQLQVVSGYAPSVVLASQGTSTGTFTDTNNLVIRSIAGFAAFGFSYNSFDSGDTLSVALDGVPGATFQLASATAPDLRFFGVTSTDRISAVRLVLNDTGTTLASLNIANVVYTPVPEPSGGVLGGLGALGLMLAALASTRSRLARS